MRTCVVVAALNLPYIWAIEALTVMHWLRLASEHPGAGGDAFAAHLGD